MNINTVYDKQIRQACNKCAKLIGHDRNINYRNWDKSAFY